MYARDKLTVVVMMVRRSHNPFMAHSPSGQMHVSLEPPGNALIPSPRESIINALDPVGHAVVEPSLALTLYEGAVGQDKCTHEAVCVCRVYSPSPTYA